MYIHVRMYVYYVYVSTGLKSLETPCIILYMYMYIRTCALILSRCLVIVVLVQSWSIQNPAIVVLVQPQSIPFQPSPAMVYPNLAIVVPVYLVSTAKKSSSSYVCMHPYSILSQYNPSYPSTVL